MSVQFELHAMPLKESDGFVYRPGKYFEINKTFTDRQGIEFGVSRAEAEVAVAQFTPQPIGLIHEPTPLDGLFGNVERLWIDGDDIMAEFAIPKWLNDGKSGQDLKISSEWDIATKLPGSAHLVFEPAVHDAVIKAAFAAHPEIEAKRQEAVKALFERHDTPSGQMALQDVHDACARAGAVCDKKNTAKMAAKHEMTALQSMHDLTTDHGAVCASGGSAYRSMSMFSEKTPVRPVITQGERPMGWKEKIRAAFKAAGLSDDKIPEFTDADLPVLATAQFSASDTARMAAQDAEIARLRARDIEREAETFIDGLKHTGQIAPYEKPGLIAQFKQAAEDDGKAPTKVKFSAMTTDGTTKITEQEGSRVEALKAQLSLRPSSGMTMELLGTGRQIGEGDLKALFSRQSTDETPEEKKKRLDAAVDAERKAHGLKN